MLLVRPIEADDQHAVRELVRARAEWLRERDLGRWRGWMNAAEHLSAQAACPEVPTWAVESVETGSIVGLTVTAETPALGWTAEEREESAIFLESTVTHPALAGCGVGMAIAFWALDQAARRGVHWVRRGVLTDTAGTNLGLVRYYRRQGWRVVRSAPHPVRAGIAVWSLARPSWSRSDLSDLVLTSQDAVGVPGPSTH